MITTSIHQELAKSTGFSIFELCMQIFGIIVSLILLCLKVENVISNWWFTLLPMFIMDGFTLYFSVIVLIRSISAGKIKEAKWRAFWMCMTLALLFTFKMLLGYKLEDSMHTQVTQPSLILAPIFVMWLLLLFRAFKIN
ncbi:transmembrane protein 203-like [Clavelina lepadiformis]|uniref:Transmembrane protein 203 n=1 Tax=Clavelina lepadiformis TaxID=159417 RepID=A0ABP0F698_CLALP